MSEPNRQVFLTGCTHFNHANIIRLANRPFDSVTEMNETMIQNWNRVVQPQDRVYHLGDFAYGNAYNRNKIFERLNGDIFLLQGNHDPDNWGKMYHTIKHQGRRVVLMHYPIEEWDGWFRGNIHCHCHTHKPEFRTAERRYNVGVDSTNFTPVPLSVIVETSNAVDEYKPSR